MSNKEDLLVMGDEAASKVKQIEAAIQDLHNSLDLREHGDVAGWNAIHKIEEVLGMPWEQGAEQARRAEQIRTGK